MNRMEASASSHSQQVKILNYSQESTEKFDAIKSRYVASPQWRTKDQLGQAIEEV